VRIPDTQYARAGEVRVAYQVFGQGPIDLVFAGGPAGHVEIYWEEPLIRRFFEWVGSYARVAMFDRRGTGASDPAEEPPRIEHYLEDVMAVIDACGFAKPAFFGGAEGGALFALFAATYPDRVSALVLNDVAPRGSELLTPDRRQRVEELIEREWGKGLIVGGVYAPSAVDDERFMRWAARLERNCTSPRGARELVRVMAETDVSDALARIKAPTLVLHKRGNTFVPVEHGRALAAAIPGARLIEVEGTDTMGWTEPDERMLGEIEEFLTGRRGRRPVERALATILFTDIVDSTKTAARLTDSRWRLLLTQQEEIVRREIGRAGGRFIKSTGDGALASFDLPARAMAAARAAIEGVDVLGVRLRAGAHVGEVELLGEDIGGLAVHIGARIAALAPPGQLMVSGAVKEVLAGSGLEFVAHGVHELKGVPGEWPLYVLRVGPDAEAG